MVRWTKWTDRDEIRALWRLRFGDSDSFLDWFFSDRFSPETSAVTAEDGRVVTSVQSYPFHVRIRGAVLPCCVIAGVSTLPDYEGRGHMGRTMRFFMNGIAERGGVVIPYRPEILAMYAGFGHFPVSRTAYFQFAPEGTGTAVKAVPLDLRRDESAMYACYHCFSERYSGIISRSLADMRLKIADYASDGARGIGVYSDGRLAGYCLYFDTEEEIYAAEAVALNDDAERELLLALRDMGCGSGKTVRGKLPPDSAAVTAPPFPGFGADVRPMGVMGVGDVSSLLRAVFGDGSVRIEVTDRTVAANNGVFDGQGRRTAAVPQLSMDAGRLAQFACGYASLSELTEQGHVLIHDAGAARALDEAYPKQECYIIDEY